MDRVIIFRQAGASRMYLCADGTLSSERSHAQEHWRQQFPAIVQENPILTGYNCEPGMEMIATSEAVDTSKFKDQLRKAVRMAIANLPGGTVGIGDLCLWQMVASLIPRHCPDAPRGTNCAYVAKQTYLEIVSEPAFSKFVYPQQS